MAQVRSMLKNLVVKLKRAQEPPPPGTERQRKVMEAAIKTGEEIRAEKGESPPGE